MKKTVSVILSIITAAALAVGIGLSAGAALAGDTNGDGVLDNKDVVTLFRYISGGGKAEDESVYDYNADGNVDNKDVVSLFRALSSGEQPGTGETTGEITVPDATLSYFPADIYADNNTFESNEGLKKTSNAKLSEFFADEVTFDPETWEVMAPAGFESVSEFVIRVAQGKYLEEIMVLKVTDKSAVDTVKALAEHRWNKQKTNEDLKLYEPTVFGERKDAGVVTVIGNFVVYAVTENTEVSILRAEKFVSENPDCSALELYKAIVIEEN